MKTTVPPGTLYWPMKVLLPQMRASTALSTTAWLIARRLLRCDEETQASQTLNASRSVTLSAPLGQCWGRAGAMAVRLGSAGARELL